MIVDRSDAAILSAQPGGQPLPCEYAVPRSGYSTQTTQGTPGKSRGYGQWTVASSIFCERICVRILPGSLESRNCSSLRLTYTLQVDREKEARWRTDYRQTLSVPLSAGNLARC